MIVLKREQAALKLPRSKRPALAERHIGGVATKNEKEIADAWADEAAARAEAYRKEKLKSVSLRRAFGFDA